MVGARRRLASWVRLAPSGLITLFVASPVLVIAASLGADTGGLWAHLASTVLPEYLRNTALLATGVAVTTVIIGVGTAWLVTLCRFPGRSLLRWALLLPLAIPTYLNAYAYTDLLQFSGPVQTWLRTTFDWSRGDYWFPQIHSVSGAILVLALGLYPYVYLAARTAFLEQSVCALEVGRTLGLGPWHNFFRVALPLARPSIIAGLTLVLMETLAEFGAVQYFGVNTFATGIYRIHNQPFPHALTAAAQLAACLLVLVALLIGIESLARRSARFHNTSTRYRDLPSWQLRGPRATLATALCALPVIWGFGIPVLLFMTRNLQRGDTLARAKFLEFGRNSLVLAAVASVLAVVLAILLAISERLHSTPLHRFLTRLSGIGYAIPGSVIAIGILVPLYWADHRLSAMIERLFGFSPGLLLGGSLLAIIYGYQTRFLAVSLNFVQAGLTRIKPSLDGAARTLGATPVRMIRSVHLPMLRGSLTAAGLLVFVDVIKELPATLILCPPNFQTLAMRVYNLAKDERLAEASTGALAIIVIGLLPVLLLSRMLDHSRPGAEGSRPAGAAEEAGANP